MEHFLKMRRVEIVLGDGYIYHVDDIRVKEEPKVWEPK